MLSNAVFNILRIVQILTTSNIRKKTLPVFLFAPLPLPIALISRFRATLRSQGAAVGERNSHNWPRKEFLLWNCHWCLLSGHDSYLPLPFSPFSLFSFSCCLESSAKNHLDKLICTSISQWVSSPALLEFLKNESVIAKIKASMNAFPGTTQPMC